MVDDRDPLQQGLKQAAQSDHRGPTMVDDRDPLQQGLKQLARSGEPNAVRCRRP